jgi:hypothetical protein
MYECNARNSLLVSVVTKAQACIGLLCLMKNVIYPRNIQSEYHSVFKWFHSEYFVVCTAKTDEQMVMSHE